MEDRNLDMYQMRVDGNTLLEIAEEYGVSYQRVSKIISHVEEKCGLPEATLLHARNEAEFLRNHSSRQ